MAISEWNEDDLLNNSYANIFREGKNDFYRLVYLYSGMVYASSRINSWCFSAKTKEMYQAFSEYACELSQFFVVGKCLDYVIDHPECRYPFILSDDIGMIWFAEYAPNFFEGESDLIFVFGPVFNSISNPITVNEKLQHYQLSISIKRNTEKIIKEIPVINQGMIEQYCRMLHFLLTGEKCDDKSFYLQRADVRLEEEEFSDDSIYDAMRDGQLSLTRAVEYEGYMTDFVSNGCVDEKKFAQLNAAFIPGNYTKKDSIRNYKDELIILTTRLADTAKESGLDARKVKTMEYFFINAIEDCKLDTELRELYRKIVREFAAEVKHNRDSHISKEISVTLDYINSNLTKPLKLPAIAEYVGYTPSYLSKKFTKELGQGFAEYITIRRVEYAKKLLLGTDKSIQDIAFMLQFGTPSYFGATFKKIVGITPQEFRNNSQ